MKLLSIQKTINEISNIIGANPSATNIGVITNDLCGDRLLINKIVDHYEALPNTKVDVFGASIITDIDKLAEIMRESLKQEYGYEINELSKTSYTDLSLSYCASLNECNVKNVIIILTDLHEIDIDCQYRIASQFRNTREKIKNIPGSIGFHSILVGKYSQYQLIDICTKKGTSYVLDDVIYVERSNLQELKYEYITINNIDDIKIGLMKELSDGTMGMINILSSENIYSLSILNQKEFNEKLMTTFHKNIDRTNVKVKEILKSLLKCNKIILRAGNLLEDLYLSGFVKLNYEQYSYSVTIRSWYHEIYLRKVFGHENIYDNISEIIPPIYYLNTIAYQKVMQIENKMRNILVYKLAELKYQEHPLKILDCMGSVKTANKNGKSYTIYEWCKHKARQQKEVYNVSTINTLTTHLDINDLEEIFSSSTQIYIEPFTRISNLFKDILPDTKELQNILNNFKRIRNPIAHNSLIDKSIIDELVQIDKMLFNKLVIHL